TVVVFTSDHGDFLCDHSLLRKAGIGSDALLHVPFVLRVPGADLPSRVGMPMSNADVLPTLAALCGVEPPEHIHGADIIPAIGTAEGRRAFAYCNRLDAAASNFTVYDTDCRMTWYPRIDYVELFDHREDPGEVRNLAREPAMAGKVEEMKRVLESSLPIHYSPSFSHLARW
ncbi:MAG: sulfatase/phosphatase domain-containing protein, partial [Planctomycetota bacterium]